LHPAPRDSSLYIYILITIYIYIYITREHHHCQGARVSAPRMLPTSCRTDREREREHARESERSCSRPTSTAAVQPSLRTSMPVCPCAYLPPRNCKTSDMCRDGGTLFPGGVRSRLSAPPRTGSGPHAAGVPFLRACRRSTARGFAAWTSSTSSAHGQGCITGPLTYTVGQRAN
jgi:hypothetical protein